MSVKRSALLVAARSCRGYGGECHRVGCLLGRVRDLSAELERTRAALRQAQLDVIAVMPDQPREGLFERKVFPAPIGESFATEVPSG